ncbi:MAG: asparaginase domain-containing protein [Acidimicrobiia bacterium]
MAKPRIAVFSGPTATITNTPDLVTSNQARTRHGLPLLTAPDGGPTRFDVLRAQRLAAPVTVYVEACSAHPLEADSNHLCAVPDGWLDDSGSFQSGTAPAGAPPVYVVELRPEDGLYLLPYMARKADGSAWEEATAQPFAPIAASRQTFYPDASRLYEEIDRFGLSDLGRPVELSSVADFDFIRAAPAGGYTQGLGAEARTDAGEGDIPPERLGEDFFVYYPYHLRHEPTLATLARATNTVQTRLASGRYIGAQWLEGSPTAEETIYWLNLVVDTTVPIVGHAGQRRHQALSCDGDRNIVDGIKYLTSGVATDKDGRDRVGAVVIIDELVYSAREVAKVDARPGGYEATGGHGGVVADMGGHGPPQLTYVPTRRHTYCSDVRLSVLPSEVTGVTGSLDEGVLAVPVATKRDDVNLESTAIPVVTISKYSEYSPPPTGPDAWSDPAVEVEILARISANLMNAPLAGFVCEGMSPFAIGSPTMNAALSVAVFAGMPVVRVGRGNTGGMARKTEPIFVAGNNLTATKARVLLMAAILKLGALPPAADPRRPTEQEHAATSRAVGRYQEIFDTH